LCTVTHYLAHYAAYDMENSDGQTRYGFNAVVTTQDLVEYYLPTFKACIRDAQGASLMTSYNAVNGVPTSTSSLFLETIARERWGFNKYNSFVTSDCDAVSLTDRARVRQPFDHIRVQVGNVFDSHHYTSSYAAAAGQSINAGVDLDCGGTYSTYLRQAISQGITNETTVRKAATRLYATLVRLGYFDPASTQPLRSLGWSAVNTAYAQSLTYRAAWEGVVLLKNNGVLPLSTSKYHTVALIGPWADNSGLGGIYGGPSTFTTTIRQGMTSTFTTVSYQLGSAMSGSSTSGFAAALSAAKSADVVVFCGGIDSTYEAETLDRANITWPTNQLSLINQLAAVGKPMVVVQLGGGQLDDSQFVSNANIGAIVWAGYPGQSGGQAVADILSGKQAPAGRLPVTQYPASYANAVQVIDMNLRPSSSTPGRTYKWYTGTPVCTTPTFRPRSPATPESRSPSRASSPLATPLSSTTRSSRRSPPRSRTRAASPRTTSPRSTFPRRTGPPLTLNARLSRTSVCTVFSPARPLPRACR
jgi:beta-D-xylosidase 4